MKQLIAILLVSVSLAGCVTTQKHAPAPVTVSQIQGGCFASREKFVDQMACIKSGVSSSQLNPYSQEYMAYMDMLSKKVVAGKMSEADARLKLAEKLNDLRQKQNNEFAVQDRLDRERTMQAYEILNSNRSSTTNCHVMGNQLSCTTY